MCEYVGREVTQKSGGVVTLRIDADVHVTDSLLEFRMPVRAVHVHACGVLVCGQVLFCVVCVWVCVYVGCEEYPVEPSPCESEADVQVRETLFEIGTPVHAVVCMWVVY